MKPYHASLPMYDLPELRAATNAWWGGIARHLRAAGVARVPQRLDRSLDAEQSWQAPRLLLSQTCGYPLMREFNDQLAVLMTPVYAAHGCDGIEYSSAVVVRWDDCAKALEDLRRRVCAINSIASHSGYNALRLAVAPLSGGTAFFARVLTTGAHASSLRAVSNGDADVCAVDAVTWALLQRYRPPATAALRVLAWTERAPALPYVTRKTWPLEMQRGLLDGLAAAVQDSALAAIRAALLIEGLRPTTVADYQPILEIERRAVSYGYAQLR